MARENKKTEKYWKQKYDDFVSSGLSQSRWCKQNGIPTSTFDYWKNKFSTNVSAVSKSKIKQDSLTDVAFAELPHFIEDVKDLNTASIIIHLNQAKIEVNNSCSDLLMASLIKAINNA